ncbi:MAG: type II secretion system F family protein [Planctomycetaceae bacterium]|jgi:type IV pilus assembly protein PilC|nr:type II secretion system F family protein [Planctomycetaceae bacterium]
MSQTENHPEKTSLSKDRLQAILAEVKQVRSREWTGNAVKFCLLSFAALAGSVFAMTAYLPANGENFLHLLFLVAIGLVTVLFGFFVNFFLSAFFSLFVWTGVCDLRKRTMHTLIQTALETKTSLAAMVRMYALECYSPLYADKLNVFAAELERGKTLSQALFVEPGLVRYDAAGIIQLGSDSGQSLRILESINSEERNRTFIRSLSIVRFYYLCSLVPYLGLVASFLICWIVPQLEKIFMDFGMRLPWVTTTVIAVSNFLKEFWILFVLGLIALSVFLLFWILMATGIIMLRPFGFRRLFRSADSARLLRMLSVGIGKNVPIPHVIDTYRNVTPSGYLADRALQVRQLIVNGSDWIGTLRKKKYLTAAEASLLTTAERTGNADAVLGRIAQSRELAQIDQMDFYGKMLFLPCMLAIGFFIGFFVIAMFLPLITLIQALS